MPGQPESLFPQCSLLKLSSPLSVLCLTIFQVCRLSSLHESLTKREHLISRPLFGMLQQFIQRRFPENFIFKSLPSPFDYKLCGLDSHKPLQTVSNLIMFKTTMSKIGLHFYSKHHFHTSVYQPSLPQGEAFSSSVLKSS